MDFFESLSREHKILLVVGGLFALANPQLFFVVLLIVLAALVLTRDHPPSNNRTGRINRPDVFTHQDDSRTVRYVRPHRSGASETFERPAPRPIRAPQVYDHALDAVRNAGRDPERTPVLPVDIGVLTYHGSDEPRIVRDWEVPDDVDYIQPFVQLRLPQPAEGEVRFEIVDAQGKTLYVHTEEHLFERGRNLIVPTTRLPIHDEQAISQHWELRISVGNILLARHRIEWEDTSNPNVQNRLRRHIGADGELSSELRAVLAENRLQTMSLDDLLSDQESRDDPPRRARQS